MKTLPETLVNPDFESQPAENLLGRKPTADPSGNLLGPRKYYKYEALPGRFTSQNTPGMLVTGMQNSEAVVRIQKTVVCTQHRVLSLSLFNCLCPFV